MVSSKLAIVMIEAVTTVAMIAEVIVIEGIRAQDQIIRTIETSSISLIGRGVAILMIGRGDVIMIRLMLRESRGSLKGWRPRE